MEDYKLIQELVSAVKELSPLAWEAAQQQIQARIIIESVWLVGLLVINYLLLGVLNKSMQETKKPFLEQNDIHIPGIIFSGLGMAVVTFIGLWTVDNLVSALVAPDYQSIKLLIDLVK